MVSGSPASISQEIVSGTHRLIADEPVSAGGEDLGLSPYEFLLAALGSCTSMTVGMYARRKDWPLRQITVRLRHSRAYAKDCAECPENDMLLDRIERDIRLDGDLSGEQRMRLIEIANRCPVHRTLTSRIDIQTREI